MRSLALAVTVAVLCGCQSATTPRPEEPSPASTSLIDSTRQGRSFTPEAELAAPLTVEACVRLALRRTPDLAAFEARIEAARAQVVAAETWPNPTLGLLAQDVGQSERALAQVQVSHPVLFGWTRGASERLARARVEGAVHDADEERRLIATTVGEAFYDALLAGELVSSEQAAVETASDLRALLARRAALGDASLLEEERARAEELEALRMSDQAHERRELARALLAQLVGARGPDVLQLEPTWPELDRGLLADSPPEEGAVAQDDAVLLELVAIALGRRPDARRARSRRDEADLSGELERRRGLPLADVTLTLGARSGPEGNAGLVSVALPLPVFDTNQGGRRRAAAEALAATADVARADRRIALEVETALVASRRAQRRLRDLALPLAGARDRALAIGRRLFEGGELAPAELVLLRRDAVLGRRAVALARRDLALARWRLLAATSEVVVGS